MNTPDTPLVKPGKPHPLLIAAAIAVILFCLAGTAAILGWLPGMGKDGNSGELTASDRAALAAPLPTPPAPMLDAERSARVERERARAAERRREPAALAAAAPARSWCSHCGNVESVREIRHAAQGSGLGAAGGAVIGGLVGNQIGDGNGRTLATVAGAVGGAVVGNKVEGKMKASHAWEIRVRLDDGSARSFERASLDGYRTGERVKVVDGTLQHMQ